MIKTLPVQLCVKDTVTDVCQMWEDALYKRLLSPATIMEHQAAIDGNPQPDAAVLWDAFQELCPECPTNPHSLDYPDSDRKVLLWIMLDLFQHAYTECEGRYMTPELMRWVARWIDAPSYDSIPFLRASEGPSIMVLGVYRCVVELQGCFDTGTAPLLVPNGSRFILATVTSEHDQDHIAQMGFLLRVRLYAQLGPWLPDPAVMIRHLAPECFV